MQVVSVQVGSPRSMDVDSRTVRTGIHKRPVSEVWFDQEGVAGDAVMNTKHHGGPDQAVYVYSAADYAWWEGQLGRELPPGTFGENLTITAAGADPIRIGDRLRIGKALLEVTAPRIPCSVFSARMGEPNWIRRFRDARRPGFYCRVLTPGTVCPGQSIDWIPAPAANLTLGEMFDYAYATSLTREEIRRALHSPIAARDRAAYEAQLDQHPEGGL